MKRILVVAAAALALAGCDAAVLSGSDGNDDTLDIPEIADGDISEKTMVDVTRELSSDEFEGRMPGSEGEKKTVELLTQRFEAAGLQPGNDGKWTQDVPLVEITGSDFAPLSITVATWMSGSTRAGLVPVIALFALGLLLLGWVNKNGDRAA